ncbi:hypothetical protein PDESU_01104 [Pontiella desulfatans]|uniref:Uncharacterized protein n=1 Tax=Pontiella desulfatans TaxID=2750659 RepID=A0A6C2TYX0_PONDE|nr:hypothetical protein [Pontiella desulfatans]VGO12551.1 hypothetical protein PDESU_01104 [Pontiella desulfatans]
MKKVAEIISYLSLVLIVLAPILFYAGKVDLEMNKLLLTTATVTWFASALCWIGRETSADSVPE